MIYCRDTIEIHDHLEIEIYHNDLIIFLFPYIFNLHVEGELLHKIRHEGVYKEIPLVCIK